MYIRITLDWDYQNRTLETSVPGYVKKDLHELQHPMPAKPQHAPAAAPIQYGAKQQTVIPEDTSPPLSADGIKCIQKQGSWNVCLVFLGNRKTIQSNRTTQKGNAPIFGLLYCATHPDEKQNMIREVLSVWGQLIVYACVGN